jgi:anthranilate/para-aminobenzoate synthase component II
MILRVWFCPDSIMTEVGKYLLKNFLQVVDKQER